jgi:hypothetical protein
MQAVSLLIVCILLSSCASVGTGRPEVVRAEDVKVNSLSVWMTAMAYHEGHSKEETPAVYATLEQARTKFPVYWRALDAALKVYKKTGQNLTQVTENLAVIEPIYDSLTGLIKSGVIK